MTSTKTITAQNILEDCKHRHQVSQTFEFWEDEAEQLEHCINVYLTYDGITADEAEEASGNFIEDAEFEVRKAEQQAVYIKEAENDGNTEARAWAEKCKDRAEHFADMDIISAIALHKVGEELRSR